MAHAYTGPVTAPEHVDDVLGFLEKGTSTDIPGVDQNSVRTKDWLEEHRPIPGQPSSDDMWDDLDRLKRKAKLLPRFANLMKFTLGGVATTVAIEYGPGLFQQIFLGEGTASAPGLWGSCGVILMEKGQQIVSNAGGGIMAPRAMKVVRFDSNEAPGCSGTVWDYVRASPPETQPVGDYVDLGVFQETGVFLGYYTVPFTGNDCRQPSSNMSYPNWPDMFVPSQQFMFGATCAPSGGSVVTEARGERLHGSELEMQPDAGGATEIIKAPTTWPGKPTTKAGAIAALGEALDTEPKMKEHLEQIITEEGKDPYASYVTVPNCDELTWGACKAAIEGAELVPVRESIDWSEVETDVPAEVLTVTPPTGNEVKTGTGVTVKTNPDESGMPVVVPAPEVGETYDEYVARLNPALQPKRVDLSETTMDPEAGPNGVVTVQPEPGSRHNPAINTEVTIRVNPPTAPPIDGGSSCGGDIGGVDWSPLNQPVGSKFPFGVFGFFVAWIGEWETGDGDPPLWNVTFVPEGVFGSDGLVAKIDLAFMAPVVSAARIVFLFASFVGLLWFLGTAAAKLQGDGT